MSNSSQPSSIRSAQDGNSGSDKPIVKGAVEARQGYRGRQMVYVLGGSLILALIAYLAIHFYFAGSFH